MNFKNVILRFSLVFCSIMLMDNMAFTQNLDINNNSGCTLTLNVWQSTLVNCGGTTAAVTGLVVGPYSSTTVNAWPGNWVVGINITIPFTLALSGPLGGQCTFPQSGTFTPCAPDDFGTVNYVQAPSFGGTTNSTLTIN